MTYLTEPSIGTILLVDDNQAFVDSTRDILKMINYEVLCAKNVSEARKKIRRNKFTHLLIDLMLPDGSGIKVLEGLSAEQLDATTITIITGHPTVKAAVESMYGPKVNYLTKPISFKELRKALQGEDVAAPEPQKNSSGFNNYVELIGESPAIKELRKTIDLVAQTNANVMILGESGVGKEVVARLIHQHSQCAGELISSNCGALNRELITSELFGHEKGAFTGALARKIGVFEQAHQGTLFLDEITEMPLDLQPNLLRALETQQIVRVGGNETTAANCRVISASNRSECELAEKRCLREDLYFRLAVFPIEIPPLRTRKEDIAPLANHFLSELKTKLNKQLLLDKKTLDTLQQYSWPGNVRELRHTIHRASILTESGSKYLKLPERLSSPFSQPLELKRNHQAEVGRSLDDVEKDLIYQTLETLNGDKTKSAKVLGISTKTLYNRLNAYEKRQPSNIAV